MITKVETRATTFFLLIEIEFRKYDSFCRIHPFFHFLFLTPFDRFQLNFQKRALINSKLVERSMNEEQEEYRGEVAKAHFLQKLDSEVWNNTNFPYDWEKYSQGF